MNEETGGGSSRERPIRWALVAMRRDWRLVFDGAVTGKVNRRKARERGEKLRKEGKW
jgi:hypothetical protein